MVPIAVIKELASKMLVRGSGTLFWCTDHWEAFKVIFPSEKHKVGKEFTKAIEGVNTYLRGVCKRLIRRTTAFSKKKVLNHWAAIKPVMKHSNLRISTI